MRDFVKNPPEMYLVPMDITRYCHLHRDLPAPSVMMCEDTGRLVSEYVTKIEQILVVDMAVRTYCCSLTPSAYYIYCYTRITCTEDATDEEREFAHDLYDGDDEGHGYMDWYPLMDRIEKHPDEVYAIKVYPEEIVEAIETAEDKGLDPGDVLLDMQREYYQGNCVL